MKLISAILAKIPGVKIIGLFTLAALLFWSIFIYRYYKKARQQEQEQYQDYVRRHSDAPLEEVAVEGAQDSLRFEKETHRQMAEYFFERKQYKRAIPHFERAIDPKNVVFIEENKEFCLKLADAYLNDRRSTQAIAYLREISEVFKTDVEVLRRLGEGRFISGDFSVAAENLREALKKDSTDFRSMILLARVYLELDPKRKEIAELLLQAVTLAPKSLEANYFYGVYLCNRGDYGLAEENFKNCLKEEPFYTPAMARLGMAYFYTGEMTRAKEMYELVLSINKTDYNTLYNLGELYLTGLNDFVNAYDYFRKTVEIQPNHQAAIKKLGILALNNRNYKEACLWFEKYESLRENEKKYHEERISTDTELVEILILHATALESLGRLDDTKIYLHKALEEDPLNRVARHKLQLLQLNG